MATLSIYYVPFEHVNPAAKVFVVGLTPGRQQMWRASMAAAKALRDGLTIPEVLDAASMDGSFSCSLRTNLIKMLDEIGVAVWLGSCVYRVDLDNAGGRPPWRINLGTLGTRCS